MAAFIVVHLHSAMGDANRYRRAAANEGFLIIYMICV